MALYAKKLDPKRRTVFARIRTIIRSVAGIEEGIRWGNPTFWITRQGKPIYTLWLYGYPRTEYVNFGFFNGTKLSDPKGRLEGTGRTMRHIKVYSTTDIDIPYFRSLVRRALADARGEER